MDRLPPTLVQQDTANGRTAAVRKATPQTLAMDHDQSRTTATAFESHYGNDVSDTMPGSCPPLAESTFVFSRLRFADMPSFQRPLSSFDFSDPCTLDGTSGRGIAWSPEDNHYFAGLSPGEQCFANAAPVATSTARGNSAPPWNTATSVKGHENGAGRPLGGWQQCLNSEDCNNLALRALRAVHVAADECLFSFDDEAFRAGGLGSSDGEAQRARSMDVVLSQLEAASAVASTILKCACCMRVQLQVLVATILEKLVNWCAAVIRSTATHAGMGDRPIREQVSPQSITIGTHQLDKALQVPVIAHVMTDKLRRLKSLVEELSCRIEESNTAAGAKDGTTSVTFSLREVGLLEIIRERLIDCLRAQIMLARGDLGRLSMSDC